MSVATPSPVPRALFSGNALPIAIFLVLTLVPLFAGLIGLLASFGMMRQKDVRPSAAVEGMAFG